MTLLHADGESYDLPFAHARLQEQHHLEHVVGLSAIRHAGFGENYGVQIMDGPLAGMFSRAVVVHRREQHGRSR